ncbi:hypothetical protein B0A55_08979 [Friedmanniomyces simplex]|uniref:Major facilitator superfamily (MFS) profile domain-containing protein n=1 Tax=Friedmanniomyces simplex TaxID=329884 RepID=A0A4U0X0A0_9PEZI|nr:hypothetical protein B0A55_08979 [Friedmanniomyces simplex]
MADHIRDAPIGQLLRYITGNKILLYPEEKADFEFTSSKSGQQSPDQHDSEKAGMEAPESPPNRTDTVKKTSHTPADERTPSDYDREALELIETLRSEFHKDIEKGQNWSSMKKALASLQICLYTLAVYMGSSIYAPSAAGVVEDFHRIPSIGRNPPYMITMAIFVILCVPTALAQNSAGLLILRFLQGFFGSPALATGGASLQDMYSLIKLPYVLCLWALAATEGPALGPVISGFSVTAENWRWSIWEMLWLSGPVFISMLLFLPETAYPNILLRRVKRLRIHTGDQRLKSQSEIDQANMRPRDMAFEALYRPLQLIFMDPTIGFTAGYVALCYAIYYSFFEAWPLIYIDKYGFNVGEMGLAFLSILVGAVLSIVGYYSYIYYIMEPDIIKNGLVGLFIVAWTGDEHVQVHWSVSIIGASIFTIGVFVLMQCIFVYLPLVYPQYAASLFAGNDFARSAVAFAAVMFSRPMYVAMGIGPGVSVLAAVTAACIGGIFVLYLYGERLRARSSFSAK